MATVIDFNEFRKKRQVKQGLEIPGLLIWLHCPTCDLTQYTALRIQGGRIHKCGTLVDEVEVSIDIRAEYTISLRNAELLDEWKRTNLEPFSQSKKLTHYLDSLLKQMESNEEEYQKRLLSMNTQPISPYSEDWSPEDQQISLKLIEPFGIAMTPARIPENHFPQHNH